MTNRIKVVTPQEFKQELDSLYPNLSESDISVVKLNDENTNSHSVSVGSIEDFKNKIKSQLNLATESIGVSKRDDFTIKTGTSKELGELVRELGINIHDVAVVSASDLNNTSQNTVKTDVKATSGNKIR